MTLSGDCAGRFPKWFQPKRSTEGKGKAVGIQNQGPRSPSCASLGKHLCIRAKNKCQPENLIPGPLSLCVMERIRKVGSSVFNEEYRHSRIYFLRTRCWQSLVCDFVHSSPCVRRYAAALDHQNNPTDDTECSDNLINKQISLTSTRIRRRSWYCMPRLHYSWCIPLTAFWLALVGQTIVCVPFPQVFSTF